MARRTRRPTQTLSSRELRPLLTVLRRTHGVLAATYPGEPQARQPVHTVYGGAHLFRADTTRKLGALALAALHEYAPDSATLAEALGLRHGTADPLLFAHTIRTRVVEKLEREPVEDFRLDFEDGYGNRSDDEEDGHAHSAAAEVAASLAAGMLPPFIGIRVKPLSREMHARSLRTLDIFVTALARAAGRAFPRPFLVTIPKVMAPGQVAAAAAACAALERRLTLPSGMLSLEVMIETPQAVVAADGTSPIAALVAAGGGRVSAAHFGAYDYTALCGITAAWQHMRHGACDFARHMMQAGLAQTGVHMSDGATTILPVAPHRGGAGAPLTPAQHRENRDAVHRAWRLHMDDVRHSLVNGFYQGWDLHPAQLPTRYAALFEFFLAARAAATARLRNFVDSAAQATRVGVVFEDAATGQGLLNFFARGISSGALTLEEAAETGLSAAELHGRSFVRILESRRFS